MTNWKLLLQAAGIRALRTIAQTAAATLSTAVVFKDVDWRQLVSAALLAGLLSLLQSLQGLPEVPTETTKEEI